MFKIGIVIVLALLISSCSGGTASSTISTTTSVAVTTTSSVTSPATTVTSATPTTAVPSTTPAVTTTSAPPTTTSVPPTTPPGTTSTVPPSHGTATFDFDTGSPRPAPRQTLTPFDLTSGVLTAHFSSPYDPYTFSVQNESTTFLKLAQLTGNYLYPNQINRATLMIRFSQPVTGITLTFATVESQGTVNLEVPSSMKLSGFVSTAGQTPVGSATARGVFSSDAYPQGTISFASSTTPFNLAIIEIVPQPFGATIFLVDNIVVTY